MLSLSNFLLLLISSSKGGAINNAFRKSLGYAVQWHDMLRVEIERLMEATLESADRVIRDREVQKQPQKSCPPPSEPRRCFPNQPLQISLNDLPPTSNSGTLDEDEPQLTVTEALVASSQNECA
jgi:hypothetical protein